MKNILVLNYEFPPLGGGASPVSYQISKRYVEHGYNVSVITMGFKSLAKFEIIDGMKIYRVKCLRTNRSTCSPLEQFTYIVSTLFFLFKHLRKNKYDINHTHFAIPVGIVSLIIKKVYKLPYIITSHGSDIPGHNPYRFVFLHLFTGGILRLIVNNSKAAIAGSSYLAHLANRNIRAQNKYQTIAQAYDFSIFTKKQKEKIILFSGRLIKSKGVHHLIEAFKDEDVYYQIHILGDGPMMNELKVLARNSKTKIVFHGWLNNKSQEYIDLLSRAEIYILPSERENASVSLLEAMSAYCAVITTNVSGCPETIGEAGLVVNPCDPIAIRTAFDVISRNPEHYGDLARKRVEGKYSWDLAMLKYLEKIN